MFGRDLDNPPADSLIVCMSNQQRTVNDQVIDQLELECNRLADDQRRLGHDLQALFREIMNLADRGVATMSEKPLAMDADAEELALIVYGEPAVQFDLFLGCLATRLPVPFGQVDRGQNRKRQGTQQRDEHQ